MKTLPRFLLTFFILLVLSPVAVAENESHLFEQLDPQAEQQRLLDKYNADKEKVTQALLNTKALIKKSQGKAYLPELYLRLAELYIEKSRIAYMQVRLLNGPEVSDFSALESRNLKLQAIEIYQRILNVYPKFAERDKVHFYLAHEFKELGRVDEMLREYELLIEQYPQSPFAPEALLLSGDHYFGIGDSAKSRTYYEAVLVYSEHSAAIIARYKLAWVHINLKEFDTAVELLIASITDANSLKSIDVDTYEGLDIRLESLIDLAFIYPDHFKKEDSDHAVTLFRELSWSRTAYLDVLQKVGSRLRVRKQWPRALEVYRELIKLDNDPVALIEHAHYLFEAYQVVNEDRLQAMPGTANDIAMLVRALRLQAASPYITERDKQESQTSIEAYSRDIATTIHQRAQESGQLADYRRAAQAYRHYLSYFDEQPESLQMQQNLADSLYNSQDYFAAAIAFEQLSHALGLAEDRLDAVLYNAVQSYQRALQSPKPMNHLHTLQARSGLVDTATQYLAQFPDSEHSQTVSFNIAWIRYDEGKFEQAIAGFSSFIQRYPHGELANAAIELCIDAYQIVEDYAGLHEFTQMALSIPELQQNHKVELERLAHAAQEKIVSALTIAALDDWEQGSQNMLSYAQSHPSASLGEQALNSLMALSQENHDLKTLLAAGQNLLQKAPQSESAQMAQKMMIDAALKSGQFRLLQSQLQQYVSSYPHDPDSQEFQLQSALLLQQLGQNDQAIAGFRAYIDRYQPKGMELAQASLGLAEVLISTGKDELALQELLAARKQLAASQRYDIDALSGLLLFQRGDQKTGSLVLQGVQKSTQGTATAQASTNRRIAQLSYVALNHDWATFADLKLNKTIDAAIVQKKTERLQYLSQQYQSILNYQSPRWSVAALYRLYQIHDNYAQFLLKAPLPVELSPQEREQYQSLIAQQAQPYVDLAQQYLAAGQESVTRLGILDQKLQDYDGGKLQVDTRVAVNSYRRGKALTVEQVLQDSELLQRHQQLWLNNSNRDVVLALVKHYFDANDYAQAQVLALQYSSVLDEEAASQLQNLVGVIHFNQGNIEAAQQAFMGASRLSPSNFNALANLAALYADHGARQQAQLAYQQLPYDWQVPEDNSQSIQLVAKYLKDYRQEVEQP